MRMTPGTVELDKGVPVDFTVHVKALRDFDDLTPIILELRPVVGRGSARFGLPVATSAPGEPDIRLDGERIVITMNRTDKAARVFVHTDYPADWWAGFSKFSIEAHIQPTVKDSRNPPGLPSALKEMSSLRIECPRLGGMTCLTVRTHDPRGLRVTEIFPVPSTYCGSRARAFLDQLHVLPGTVTYTAADQRSLQAR